MHWHNMHNIYEEKPSVIPVYIKMKKGEREKE